MDELEGEAGQRVALRMLEDADTHRSQHLAGSLPATWQALADGWLRVAQAMVLMEETLLLPPPLCRQVERLVLPDVEGRTPGNLRRLVRRVAARLQDEDDVRRRRQEAMSQRRVTTQPQPDGMATVWVDMSAEDAQRFTRALRQLAEDARTEGDTRTAAQRQADVLAALPALVLSALGGRRRDGDDGGLRAQLVQALAGAGFRIDRRSRPVQVVVLVPASTAAGTSDQPGELLGHGPLIASHARRLMDDAELRRAVVDPQTGRITAVDEQVVRTTPGQARRALQDLLAQPLPEPPGAEPQHDPSPHLTRLVTLRDLTCIGPGGLVPSDRSDREHRIPWPQGPTSSENLAPVSRYWHRAKQAGWAYTRSRDGTTTWTSPLGRTYRMPADRWPPTLTQRRRRPVAVAA